MINSPQAQVHTVLLLTKNAAKAKPFIKHNTFSPFGLTNVFVHEWFGKATNLHVSMAKDARSMLSQENSSMGKIPLYLYLPPTVFFQHQKSKDLLDLYDSYYWPAKKNALTKGMKDRISTYNAEHSKTTFISTLTNK